MNTMKRFALPALSLLLLFSCNESPKPAPDSDAGQGNSTNSSGLSLQGTWQLIDGTLIEKGDTTVTDYTNDRSFIKIINATHFSFIHHVFGKDSASFGAGAGTYQLSGNQYTEHLEYCNARQWEGNEFHFTVTLRNDTLVQQGIEKVEAAGVERMNIERYVRYKNR